MRTHEKRGSFHKIEELTNSNCSTLQSGLPNDLIEPVESDPAGDCYIDDLSTRDLDGLEAIEDG